MLIWLLALLLSWWFGQFDASVTGQNKKADFKRRALRCCATLFLVWLGRNGGFLLVVIAVPLGIIWAGCLSEFFARGFMKLVDSQDPRAFDPKSLSRELDELPRLVQTGRYEQGIALCNRVIAAGDGSALAMETMLCRIYGQMFTEPLTSPSPPLAEAQGLCRQRRFTEAASVLERCLKKRPGDLRAAAMLIRLYALEMYCPAKAYAVLDRIQRGPHAPPGFADYGRQVLGRWLDPNPVAENSSDGIESLLVSHRARPTEPARTDG